MGTQRGAAHGTSFTWLWSWLGSPVMLAWHLPKTTVICVFFFHVCCSSRPPHTPNTTSTSPITAPIHSLVSAVSCFTREKSRWELGHGWGGDESRQRGIVSGYETSRRQQAMEKGNIPGRAMENMILGTVCGAGLETETGRA